MSFNAYKEYKDSGVEWLGEVPAHWVLKPIWSLFTRTKRTGYPHEELLSVSRDYGVIPKSSRSDNHNNASEDLNNYQLVVNGDLAINKMKAWQGSVAISDYKGIVSPAYHVYEKKHNQCDRYLHHLFRCCEYISGYLSNSKGIRVNQWDLEPQQHSRMPALLPSEKEQATIAAFLDHETARIDALIEEQQRLIAFLKEKRQAVISHAVTKGLDPNVPMKDSGVEWLGDVPAHWRHTSKLNQLVDKKANSFVNGPFGSDLLASELTSSGVPVIYIRDLKTWGYTRVSEHHVTSKKAIELDFCSVIAGDILVSKVGDPPGTSVVYPNDEPKAIITQDVIRIRPSTAKINPHYLSSLMNSCYGMFAIKQISVSSTRTRISLGDFKQLKLPIPPIKEQVELVNYMEKAIKSINNLEKEASNTIALMKERRSALISAAVTGKIDVRDWQPPKASQTAAEPAEASA